MKRLREAIQLYRIYRQCNPLPVAISAAWSAIKRG